MPTLTLKNVPEELVERLKAEAKQSRRSLNQEALGRLERSLAVRLATPAEKERTIRRAQGRFKDLEPLPDEFFAAAKTAGRP